MEAETILSALDTEHFDDYTEWQREHYDAMDPEEISREAIAFAKAHPYTGDAIRL